VAGSTPMLTVLMFHGLVRDIPEYSVYRGSRTCLIRQRDFDSCVGWCARNRRIISQQDLPKYLRGEATEPGVLITFDDSLASVVDLAVPVLQKHGATALVFVTTGWVEGKVTPLIFHLERDLWDSPPQRLDVRLGDAEYSVAINGRAGVRAAIAGLWNRCFAARVAPLLLRAEWIRFDGRPWEPDPARQERHVWFPATWSELSQAARDGVLEIGAHGDTHTPWSWLSDDGRRREIAEPRERLRAMIGAEVRACSYPHGMYNDAARGAARQHYEFAFTNVGRPLRDDPADLLPRFHVPGERPVLMDAILKYPLAGRVLRKAALMAGAR